MSPIFFFLLIPHQSVLLLSLSQLPELIPALPVLLIPLSNLHDLLSLSLRLLDLLPRLLLLHLQQGNTIGEQFGIVGSLLLVHASFLKCTCDFLDLRLIVVVIVVPLAVILVLLLIHLLLLSLVHFLLFKLLLGMLLSLRNWLGLLR